MKCLFFLLALVLAGCSKPPEAKLATVTPTPTPPGVTVATQDLPRTVAAPPADLQIPIYPGARAIGGGQLQTENQQETFLATLDYQTPDPHARVVSFYKARYPKARLTRLQEPGYELVSLLDSKVQITITRSKSGPTLVNLVRQK